jgi:hypothetical protein
MMRRPLSRLRILGSVLLGTVLTMSACSGGCGATKSPPPTVWSLTLEVQDKAVRVISASPSRGRVVTTSPAAQLAAIRRRDPVWIEYALRSRSDLELQKGGFLVSMTAIVEPDGRDAPGGHVRVTRRVVTVRVPYVAEAASITFARTEPSDAPADRWPRVPLGSSPLGQGVK